MPRHLLGILLGCFLCVFVVSYCDADDQIWFDEFVFLPKFCQDAFDEWDELALGFV